MNRELKQLLEEAYVAPKPQKKQDFLRRIPRQRISTGEFLLAQAGYIRKWVWLASLGIFVCAVVLGMYVGKHTLWVLSCFIPFLTVTGVAELMKSVSCGMAELEMTTRFSLRSILLARMSMIGMLHLVILLGMIPIAVSVGAASAWQAGVYLVVPYLLTCVLSVFVARRAGYRETGYLCMGCAVLVSGLGMAGKLLLPLLYEQECFAGWLILFGLLVWAGLKELYQMLYGKEDLTLS